MASQEDTGGESRVYYIHCKLVWLCPDLEVFSTDNLSLHGPIAFGVHSEEFY